MTSASVKADIERALDAVKADDTDFQYEIEMPPDPKHRVFTVVMEPFDLPKDEYILDCVLRQYRTVTGGEPDGVGTVLPGSYTGDDTCHLWAAGVPCLLYGPGGGSRVGGHPRRIQPHQRHGTGSESPGPHRPRRLQPAPIALLATNSLSLRERVRVRASPTPAGKAIASLGHLVSGSSACQSLSES